MKSLLIKIGKKSKKAFSSPINSQKKNKVLKINRDLRSFMQSKRYSQNEKFDFLIHHLLVSQMKNMKKEKL